DVTMPPNSGMNYAHGVLPANRRSSGVGSGTTMARDATAHGSKLHVPHHILRPHGKRLGVSCRSQKMPATTSQNYVAGRRRSQPAQMWRGSSSA
ncbi:MAG TPA: hypothetical protein VGT08_07825, partial [Terracidiphilus sp.]|nr:hypothetical protein [Terracidiphilus sp.]